MTTVHAYAVKEAGGKLEPFEYELGELGAHEVDVEVTSCGICHSDLSMVNNEWGMAQFPLVPGHEVAGRVKAVGEHVDSLKVGDRVGVGWHSKYCMHCSQCLGGDHNLCQSSSATIVGRHGGFADLVRVHAPSCIKMPDGVNADEMGPMLCGGITVCQRVSKMTTAQGRRVVPHCFSTGINLAASLHWISTVPDGDLVEYCLRPSPLLRKLVVNLPPVVDGRVPVPDGPGLGIELDEDIEREFTVRYE